ncbi:MAG: hypothetical protein AAF485_13815 [Chloroflexota bacterium]
MVISQHGKFDLVGGLWVRFAGLALQSNIMVQVANQSLNGTEPAPTCLWVKVLHAGSAR